MVNTTTLPAIFLAFNSFFFKPLPPVFTKPFIAFAVLLAVLVKNQIVLNLVTKVNKVAFFFQSEKAVFLQRLLYFLNAGINIYGLANFPPQLRPLRVKILKVKTFMIFFHNFI